MKLARETSAASSYAGGKLCETNLRGARLREADLYKTDLSQADLREANLSHSHLCAANLHKAQLSRADLSGADLSEAGLSSADLSYADLRGAILDGAFLTRAQLREANLRNAALFGAELREAERVCEGYTVAYAPAGSVLARLGAEAGPREVDRPLVVANPTGDLPHTPSEALAIRQALGDGRTLWEGEATEAAVIEAARDAGVIHFSGHGSYVWRAPEQSGLDLRGPDGEGVDRLTVAEMREALRLSRTREEVEEALEELDRLWTPWATQREGARMQRRAREQYWEIWRARRRLEGLEERPFGHPYWWAGFQAVGDVL